MAAPPTGMLELRGVTAGYGQFTALWGVSLRVSAGEAVAVVGPNGAGKTTLMRVISGLVSPREGDLTFEGQSLARLPAHEIVARGIAHVPEGRRIFPMLTVADNLKMGAFLRSARRGYRDSVERVYTLFPALAERQKQRAGSLSGGEQQMLAIARALMSRPKLLLCDEPSLGLAPLITKELFNIIGGLNERWGIAVLLVEQNANLAMHIAKRVYLLETGTIVASGDAETIANDDSIRKAYLGY